MEWVVSELQKVILGELPVQSSSSISHFAAKHTGSCEEPAQKLVLGANICYIVCAVIIEDGRILMMREAKASCRGKWYLPAGRLERNESLKDGVQREVLEETGHTFEPTTVICVDSIGCNWFRFTFTGRITGGVLKTLEKKDRESLEAGWFTPEEIFEKLRPLRARDIIPIINAALKWDEKTSHDGPFRSLPVPIPHHEVIIRTVLVSRKDNGIKILLNGGNPPKIPENPLRRTKDETRGGSTSDVTSRIVKKALGVAEINMDYRIHGIVSIEHVGKPHGVADGFCLTVLVEVMSVSSVSSDFQLFEITSDSLRNTITKLIDDEGCIKLMDGPFEN